MFCLLCTGLAGTLVGCSRGPSLDSKWSVPLVFTNAECHFLAKWNRSLLTRETNSTWLVLRPEESNWTRIQIPGSQGFNPVVLSPAEASGLLGRWKLTADKDQLDISFLRLAAGPDGLPRRSGTAGSTSLKRITVFGGPTNNIPPFLRFGLGTGCGSGIVTGNMLLLSYQAETEVVRIDSSGHVQTAIGNNPAEVGVLWSTNGGLAWERTKVLGFESWRVGAHATRANLYLLADDRGSQLWNSVRAVSSGKWSAGELFVKTLAPDGFVCETTDDTIHVCWMDNRRKSGLGFLVYGDLVLNNRNNQVYYRHKKDGEATWSKEKLLSGNLSFVASPTISTDGAKVVVAWQHRPGRGVNPKAGIYFITSRDNGENWSKVRLVTADDEPAAEHPRVALLGNTIHLIYNQSGNAVYLRREFPTR